jgi:hypothetical protein
MKEKRHVNGHGSSRLFSLFSRKGIDEMNRIALLVCGLVLVVASTAEARLQRRSRNRTTTRPVAAAPRTYTAAATATIPVATAPVADADAVPSTAANNSSSTPATTAAHSTTATTVRTVSYSTSTAQGVANLMAANNRVGHWGGNRGYEGCGCGATPAAAYNICCYANSGMATIDVGYARGANGMWFCCRRYR